MSLPSPCCNQCGQSNCCCGSSCTPSCDPANEPVASSLNNFIAAFFGSVTKSCVNGQVVWNLPCDLDSGITGFPRLPDEGIACYLLRLYAYVLTQIGGGSLLTTKGDLLSYSTTTGRFSVGTNGQYLIADSTEPFGLKWVSVAPPSNSYNATVVSAGGIINWAYGTDANYQEISGIMAAPLDINLIDTGTLQNGDIFHVKFEDLVTTSVNKINFNQIFGIPLVTLDDDITQSGNLEFIWNGSDWIRWSVRVY